MLEAQSGKFLGWCRVMVPGDRGYWMVHEFQLVEKKTLRHSYFRHGEQEKDTIHCVYIYIFCHILRNCHLQSTLRMSDSSFTMYVLWTATRWNHSIVSNL